jgi:DNA-binding transcriptional MerR regulator
VAKRSHVSIGDVLTQLRDEFPDVTISKIRFLESQGLVDPERTPSGYRKFYSSDVERLRWILRQQREHFLPLKVIKERLDEIDREGGFSPASEAAEAPVEAAVAATSSSARSGTKRSKSAKSKSAPDASDDEGTLFEATRRAADAAEARVVAASVRDDGNDHELAPAETGVSLTRTELARAAGLGEEQLVQLEEYGLISSSHTSRDRVLFDEDALAIARAAAGFMRHGVEPRHLRMYRAIADREASLFAQVLLPYRRQRNPEAQARTAETLGELATLGRRLRTALLRQAVRETLTG